MHYVARNALLPQITFLALQIGLIFSGAIITEVLFSYPGLGTLIYHGGHAGRLQSDDGHDHAVDPGGRHCDAAGRPAYPLLDPRVRLR